MRRIAVISAIVVSTVVLVSNVSSAQGTVADYQRAMGLRERYEGLTVNVPQPATWIEKTSQFWYRKTVKGGTEFVLVDAATQQKEPPFDHQRLADSLNTAVKPEKKYTAVTLPFNAFTFADGQQAIEVTIQNEPWRCQLSDYNCSRNDRDRFGRGGRGRGGRGGGLAGPVRPEFDINGIEAKKSPDGKFEAVINNYNVAIREVGKRDVTLLSTDGSEGGYYDPNSLVWSPDSKKIAVYKIKPGFRRYVHYVQSSPEDQLQPKNSTLQYAKPGDVLDVERPVIFHIDTKKALVVDNELFPNAYDQTPLTWWKDSRGVTFEYNQRGHQLYRVIEIDAMTAKARSIISEESKTFFCYSGKKYRFDANDGKEIVWMSERDGWNHLYLYDGTTGQVKTQITKGNWPVRTVIKVDEDKRQIFFSANGMNPGKDPYFVHYYRINFDGTGLTTLTQRTRITS
jgi:Dipeptidyl peptidase IV (DPP IV) N-terminal region